MTENVVKLKVESKIKSFVKKHRNEIIILALGSALFAAYAYKHKSCVEEGIDSAFAYANKMIIEDQEIGIMSHVSGEIMNPGFRRI